MADPTIPRRRPLPLGWLALALALAGAGCGGESPNCNRPVLSNEQETAVVRIMLATTEGMVAAAPDTTAAAVVREASAHEADRPFLIDDDPCGDNSRLVRTYQLVIADLVANAEDVSPEVGAGFTRAAEEGGASGVVAFLHDDDDIAEPDYPGLHEMRARLRVQYDAADDRFDTGDEPAE